MRFIILALALCAMFSTASAHPCDGLDLNSSTQEDFNAIVLAGCNPFEVLRQRRLGRPRVQQIDIDDTLAMAALSGALGGSSTSSTGTASTASTSGGLGGLGLLAFDDDLAKASLLTGGKLFGGKVDPATALILADVDSENLAAASLMSGGSLGGKDALTQALLLDEITLKSIRRKNHQDARMIHALTSGPSVTPEQLQLAADLHKNMKLRAVRRARAEAATDATNSANKANDLFPGDMGDYMEDMMEMQMMQQMMGGQGVRGVVGGAAAPAAGTAPSPAASTAAQNPINMMMQAELLDDVMDGIDRMRLRSPRATKSADATNSANNAQMNDGLKAMIMMQAMRGSPSATTNALLMAGGDGIDDDAMMYAMMAQQQKKAATTAKTTTPTTTATTTATKPVSTATTATNNNALLNAMMMADNDMAGAQLIAQSLKKGNMGQAMMIADIIDYDGNMVPSRRLRSPRVRQPRPNSRLVPVYRKLN